MFNAVKFYSCTNSEIIFTRLYADVITCFCLLTTIEKYNNNPGHCLREPKFYDYRALLVTQLMDSLGHHFNNLVNLQLILFSSSVSLLFLYWHL